MMPNIKTTGSFVISLVVVSSAIVLIRGQAQNGVWKQFTIEKVEKSAGQPAGNASEQIELAAQRSDGSQVTFHKTAGVRDIYLAPTGEAVKVSDFLKAKTTLYRKKTSPRQPPAYDSLCGLSLIAPGANPVLKGTDEVLGYKTVVIETQQAPYVNTIWRAPELGCAALKVSEDRRDEHGAVIGHFEMQALSIKEGAPDRALFTIPTSYTERSPREMHRAYTAKKGGPTYQPNVCGRALIGAKNGTERIMTRRAFVEQI